jgi:hypothetical protein
MGKISLIDFQIDLFNVGLVEEFNDDGDFVDVVFEIYPKRRKYRSDEFLFTYGFLNTLGYNLRNENDITEALIDFVSNYGKLLIRGSQYATVTAGEEADNDDLYG